MSESLDPRLHAWRPDLADLRLAGRVAADRFAAGTPRRVVAPASPLKAEPRPDAPLLTELIRGETVLVFDAGAEGWSWVQHDADGYVGWVAADALGAIDPPPTHRVTALRTFVYPGPDMKLPAAGWFSFASRLALAPDEIETRGTRFRRLAGGEGMVVARHVAPLGAPPEADFVAVAERFVGTPYLWGGRTSLGLDCSALVQLSLSAAGIACPRDTDMQESVVGRPVEGGVEGGLRRGDLVYWKGHVGIVAGAGHMVHASGHHMEVVVEPFAEAVARIAASGSRPTSVRRL